MHFSNISSIIWRILTHIVLSRILYVVLSRIWCKFPSKAFIYFGFQKFSRKIISGTKRINFVILSFQVSYRNFQLTSYIFWCFFFQSGYFLVFKRSLKNCIWNITGWPILSFQGSNFRLKQIHFLVFKSLFKKLYQGRCSKDFIEISTWGHILFAFKRLLKNVSRTLQFDPYYCFKDLIQIFN